MLFFPVLLVLLVLLGKKALFAGASAFAKIKAIKIDKLINFIGLEKGAKNDKR